MSVVGLLILLIVRHTLSWHACDSRLCFNETNGLCNTSQEKSGKKKYCDVNVGWEDSCRTDDCFYIFDTSQSSIANDFAGTITSVKEMIVSNDAIDLQQNSAHCWSYMILPDSMDHFYYQTSCTHMDYKVNFDIAVEFKMFGTHDANYVVSIPCEVEEGYPTLVRKDIVIYFLNDPSPDSTKRSATEYKIQWIASKSVKNELSSWKHIEVFQDALTPPTIPPTTTEEETTQQETTVATTITTSSTEAESTTTTTPPFYAEVTNSKLAKVSKDLYDNEATNKQTNFSTTEVLTLSSEKTIEVNDNLADVITDENIDLEPELAISYITIVSENTNTFVASKNAETWRHLSEKTEILNEIIENADNVTNTIVKSIEPKENITEIQRVNSNSVSIMIVPTQTEEQLTIQPSINVEIGLPVRTVSSLTKNEVAVVAASVHSGAQECYHDLYPDEVDIFAITSDNGTADNGGGDSVTFKDLVKFQIITEIVSVNIKPKPVNQAIRLSFRHIRDISEVKNFTLYCAYIDKITSRWTHHKCNIIETNYTHTTFISNHLTNFAILMQIVDFEIPESDRKNLELITYIGLSISVFCLVLSLCIFALVNNVRGQRTERYHLHANLALGMLLGQVTFLAGSGHPPGSDSCKATAILLHFFYLTSFSWMLVEGFHLYNLVVKVFKSSQSKLGYYYMIGWGLPLLICVISVSAAFDGYGERGNCWLDMNNSRVIWAFVGPVLFVILINIIILVKVSKVISSLAKSRDNCIDCMTDAAAIAVCVKAIAVLMPILGVTWIFGVIAVNQNLIAFQYIFAIFNSLQGFFLFVFHCVFNSETRSTLIYRTKSLRSDVPSKSGNIKGRRGTKTVKRISSRNAWNRMELHRHGDVIHDITSSSRQQASTPSSSQSSANDVRPTRKLLRSHRVVNPTPMNAW